MSGAEQSPSEGGPILRVVTPDATPEEIAALVAVFASIGAPAEAPPAPRSEWASPARRIAPAPPHGSGGWRSSGLPR
ncbi:MAG TPA: acyl-CoA carboxylase subunit epsilon [Marmoricola sp.]|nr:acyl-CoA carboxylase subunit epsilon [Marmoricola sp.]